MKQARIANMQYEGSRFRKVRLTYFDAGPNVQVGIKNNSWLRPLLLPVLPLTPPVPSHISYCRCLMPCGCPFEYDVPMLGVDLISLGKQRVLSVIDMQPLHPDEAYSKNTYKEVKSQGSKQSIPTYIGKLSGKIYDDTSFFSSNMLFGRFTDETKLKPVVHPAHAEYLAAYHEMVASATPNNDPKARAIVRERQAAYDKYSAEKDPAVAYSIAISERSGATHSCTTSYLAYVRRLVRPKNCPKPLYTSSVLILQMETREFITRTKTNRRDGESE